MKKLLALSSLVLAIFLVVGIAPHGSAAKEEKLVRSVNAIPGRYIVVLNEKTSGREGLASPESTSFELAGEYRANIDKIYEMALKGFSAELSEKDAIALSMDDRVMYVEEDALVMSTAIQPNATWGIDRIDQRTQPLNSSFQYTASGAGVNAYIIDSGIRTTHQEFGGRANNSVDFTNDGQNGNDCYGHGTHVAGTVGSSTYGVAKNVTLHSVRVLRCDGSGMVSELVAAVNWVTANRINPAVANISITASGGSNSLDSALESSIASGVTYSVAAGNFGSNACNYSPARTPNVLTVGSIASNDYRPGYSNQGPCLDLYAPGNGVLSLSNGDDVSTRFMNGTSMASPHVAGVAALYLESNPNASPAIVSQQIMNGTTEGVVWNTDGVSPNRLLHSWIGGAQPPTMPGRVTIIKQVTSVGGGTASNASFGYLATNLGTATFALIDNDVQPADRYVNPNIVPLESAGDITITEGSLSGWSLTSIQCQETPGDGMSNIQNSTVNLASRQATIKVEPGESVTCTFNSQELAPSAAPANVSGRVVDRNGRGIKNVWLTVQNAATGERSSVMTNSFGYYTFFNLMTGNFYTVTASAKRYVFDQETQSFVLNDSLTGVNFVGNLR